MEKWGTKNGHLASGTASLVGWRAENETTLRGKTLTGHGGLGQECKDSVSETQGDGPRSLGDGQIFQLVEERE